MNKKAACLLLSAVVCLSGCRVKEKDAEAEEAPATDLPQIIGKGEITAVTLYSSTSYFQYRMEPMGYEYDLIRDFASGNNLKLTIKVAENELRLIEMLEKGEADVVAYPIAVENRLKERLLYCGREEVTHQVLVQAAGKGGKLLRDVTGLIGKDVYVMPGTKYRDRMNHLNSELGGGIHIHDIGQDTITTEDLIAQVADGTIPYTVADDKVARLNKTYYWNIDISLSVSFEQRSSWVVRKSSPLLAEAINQWAADKSDRTYKAAIKRYFELSKKIQQTSMPEIKAGNISPYDALFRKYAPSLGWDWQLLASVAYQESQFHTTLESWAGAQGLMGIMPGTARLLGVTIEELADPETSIRTGVEVLKRFRRGFRNVTDTTQLIKLTLASYNAGIGHIYDAQKLAGKYGKDPLVWDDNVGEYILMKRYPEYYNDPLVKHGYLRGTETYNYVKEVMDRYAYYLRNSK